MTQYKDILRHSQFKITKRLKTQRNRAGFYRNTDLFPGEISPPQTEQMERPMAGSHDEGLLLFLKMEVDRQGFQGQGDDVNQTLNPGGSQGRAPALCWQSPTYGRLN